MNIYILYIKILVKAKRLPPGEEGDAEDPEQDDDDERDDAKKKKAGFLAFRAFIFSMKMLSSSKIRIVFDFFQYNWDDQFKP